MNAEIFRIVLGVNGGEVLGDDGEVGFSLADRDPRFEVSEEEPEDRKAGTSLRCGRCRVAGLLRNPHVGIAPTETWRHDTDKGVRRAVEDKSLVDESRIGVETSDPSFVAHNEDRRRAWLVIGRLCDTA